jgi:hypothetical protein
VTTPTGLHRLYERLGQVGISSQFARRALPSWWDDSIASVPSGVQQAALLFSRAFNIDVGSLAEDRVRFRAVEHKFKLNKDVSPQEVSASAHFATAIARLVLSASPAHSEPMPIDAGAIRADILGRFDSVGLDGLLDFCRRFSVPVIHIKSFPGKKMTGLAIRIADRYAVILGHSKHPAYMLFNLAHELGHIVSGHLQRDGFVADEKIGRTETGDADEKQANAFASVLLNGKALQYKSATGRFLTASTLKDAALKKSREIKVDAGHIVLNYAHSAGGSGASYATANAALKLLPIESRGEVIVDRSLTTSIDWDLLSEDQMELIQVATEIERPA